MTKKVNGAVEHGIWVEKQVSFVKVTFSKDVQALVAADLVKADGSAVNAATVADTSFGVVESALAKALKVLATRATVLGVSKYDAATNSVDVFLGVQCGWFANAQGKIASAVAVSDAQAVVTTAGATEEVGEMVKVADGALTFDLDFAAFRNLPIATEATGDLSVGFGSTPGNQPVGGVLGTDGFYPTITK